MDWSTKRKLVYALMTIVFISTVVVLVLREQLFPEPTCFDIKKNGYELNVDCGGLCDKKCTEEVAPLTVLWAKAIKVATSTYDIAGLVSNTNIDNASRELGYRFTLFNQNGGEITSLFGSTTAPLDGKFPLIVQNIKLDEEPTKTSLTLFDTDHYKVKESPTSPTVKIAGHDYSATDRSRLYATIINTKRIEIRDLEVRVVLFDAFDNAYAVGRTVVPILDKEGSAEIVFTWGEVLAEAPTRIGLYPIFSPFDVLED